MADVCHYCEAGEKRDSLMYEIAKLGVSTLYLFREQSHKGRCVLAVNRHVGDLTDLDVVERDKFFAELTRASAAIQKVCKPDKVNYAAFGDLMQHLHFHLVPKYKDGFEWGGVFAMNPGAVVWDKAQSQELIGAIRGAL